jgi:hypothetical protein
MPGFLRTFNGNTEHFPALNSEFLSIFLPRDIELQTKEIRKKTKDEEKGIQSRFSRRFIVF